MFIDQFASLDVRQTDRAQSVETLLSPLSHVPLSAKNSASVVNSIATISSGNFRHYFSYCTLLLIELEEKCYLVSGKTSVENSTTTQTSQDPNKTISVSGLSGTSGSNSTSTDSERTYRVDSQDSQISDTETSSDRHWPRQNSVSDGNLYISKYLMQM